jgi:septal ring factor EnvC (AmiA/AmiB activator)
VKGKIRSQPQSTLSRNLRHIKKLEKKLQERDADKEQLETTLHDQNNKLKKKVREKTVTG